MLSLGQLLAGSDRLAHFDRSRVRAGFKVGLVRKLKTRFFLLFLLVSVSETASAESVLQDIPAPQILDLYNRPFNSLTEREQWRIRIHGLRLSPLHPEIWGALKRERTENRQLVPIKRYFLRDSESADFKLNEIKVKFKFKAEGARYMAKMPHQKDPVFEIGFGGVFREHALVELPDEDLATVLRLSAFQPLGSGFYERRIERMTEVAPATPKLLAVGTSYEVRLICGARGVQVWLDGQPISQITRADACRGLVHLQTSWHPVYVEDLQIIGETDDAKNTRRTSRVVYSGLVAGVR